MVTKGSHARIPVAFLVVTTFVSAPLSALGRKASAVARIFDEARRQVRTREQANLK
jgi:hypothetical protein